MIKYTGLEYTKIAIANAKGMDKKTFAQRLAWVNKYIDRLEKFASKAEEKFMYTKAVYALRDAQAGIPSGFMFELDGTASCQQIYAALMGCHTTAKHVNLINTGKRVDLYADMAKSMGLGITRAEIKYPLMCKFYNSKNKPKELFGDGTPEYVRFMHTMAKELPGAEEGMELINNCWQSDADAHMWEQLDGMVCHVRVHTGADAIIEAQELPHSFTYAYELYGATDKGISLPANIIQSFDALIVREMKRRCNYNRIDVTATYNAIKAEIELRGPVVATIPQEPEMICQNRLLELPIIDIRDMSDYDLQRCGDRLEKMLEHKSFPLITRHDAFCSHPNNMNVVRYNYKEILAEIADAPALSNILSSLTNGYVEVEKYSYDLSNLIRESEYSLS